MTNHQVFPFLVTRDGFGIATGIGVDQADAEERAGQYVMEGGDGHVAHVHRGHGGPAIVRLTGSRKGAKVTVARVALGVPE